MNALQPFQQFQHDFGRHLRDPRRAPRPAGVPARRAAIYTELLFNNLTGFLDACYPVTRSVLGETRWRRLQRAFFREARCHTPYFREIPREFLDWLPATAGPAWLKELAHYEWVELALDVMDAEASPHDPRGDLLDGIPVLAPALMNLAYPWPVQRIGPDYRPRKPRQTHLLVYRDADDEVRFIELNPVSARLVDLLREGRLNGHDACAAIAAELGHADPQAVIGHGARLLAELHAAGALLGVRT
ncbi:MAG: putative DNA-binding domain-containing protein [Pseudomonadota bacterium]